MKVPAGLSSQHYKYSLTLALWLGLAVITGLSGCGSSSSSDPTVSITDASVSEGDSGTTDLVFTITANKSSSSDITVTYATSDGTATAGSDYDDTHGTVVLPEGDTSVTIVVPVIGDTDFEDDETVTLVLSAASGANLGTASVTGTILNDDNADPNGYYSGTASVKTDDGSADVQIADLRAIVSGNRFMMFSVNTNMQLTPDESLLYDGTITSQSGSDFNATVDIYRAGALILADVAVSGQINPSSSITGTLSGTGTGYGTFDVTYSLDNDPADLVRLGNGAYYIGVLNGAIKNSELDTTHIYETGVLLRTDGFLTDATAPVLSGCDYDTGSTLSPVAGINVYDVTVVLSGCNDTTVNGSYTGFASSYQFSTTLNRDYWLLLTYSNGSFSGSGVLLAGLAL